MVKIKYLLIAALIVILGIVMVITVFPSEEKRVKKQFRLLSEWVSKSTEENAFTMLQRMKDIGSLFDAHCELKVPDQSFSGSYSREEISTYAGSARSQVSQLDLKFYDLQVVFPEKEVAKVTLTARLTGRSTAGERMDETRELECLLRKIEKKWLFSQIEVIEVLKK
jgi:ketosteroid isomerase-like protein